MDNNSQQKVIAAKPYYHIVAKTKDQTEWHILERDFPSKAARSRRFKELLEGKKVIQD